MNVNPYQAPVAQSYPTKESSGKISRAPFVAFVIGALAYHLIVWLLLSSTPVDREVGTLLLINTPVFAGWGIAVWLGSRHSITLGMIACAVQFFIAAIAILLDIGDWQASVLLTAVIMLAFVAMIAVCWRYRPITELLDEQIKD